MWYVILSKPRQEQRAALNLSNQGGEVYLPILSVERIKNGKLTQVEEPLFPGYLFLKVQEQGELMGKVRSTYGVRGILKFGDHLVTVAEQLIEDIRLRSQQKAIEEKFTPGQKIRFVSGTFKDYEAIFANYNGEERAFIFINMLGQQNRLLVELQQIADE